jgi:hypothetical protein
MDQERERGEVLGVSWKVILKRISAVIGSVYSTLGVENLGSSVTLVLRYVLPKMLQYDIIFFRFTDRMTSIILKYDSMPVIQCVGKHER